MKDNGRRLATLGLMVLVLFSALLVRVTLLGTVESKSLTDQGEATLRKVVPIAATRGRVLARDGRVLVDNLAVNTVHLDTLKLPKTERTAVLTRLASLLDVSFSTIESRLVDPRNPRYEPAGIASDVKESAIIYIAEHPELFPPGAVTTGVTWQRVYPFGRLAAHVLGYLGRVNPDDIKRQPTDLHYQPSDLIGRAGIEKSFERELRGVPGEEIVTLDPKGRVVASEAVRDPVSGNDVRLALDIDLQKLGEETIVQGLNAARKNVEADNPSVYLKADAGALVVLDVTTGEVVASVSYPTYDPAEFVEGLSKNSAARLNSPTAHAPLINRVIEGKYPPGSTFKLFTAIAALQNKLITPNTTYLDQGSFDVEEYKKQNIKWSWKNAGRPPTAFGVIDLRNAIRVSSDAFFYKLGFEFHGLGKARETGIQNVARQMGLGKYTNIRLPQESRGVIPDRTRQELLHKLFPTKFASAWPTGATINVSIGQGDVLVTPLQLARAYAALANGGTVLDARIELEVINRAVSDQNATKRNATRTPRSSPNSTIVPTTTPKTQSTPQTTSPPLATSNPATSQSPTPSTKPDFVSALGIDLPPQTTLPPVSVPPQVEGHIDISDADRTALIGGFRDVVSQRGGTAVSAFEGFPLAKYPIAGKTGTAQKAGQQDYSVFVGFGPVPAPKYAIAVIIEQGGFGRQSAALVRRMFEGIAGLPIGPVRTVTQGGIER